MKTDSIRHDEAMIRHFIDDPEFAEIYLEEVLRDGGEREIRIVRDWYEEARRRTYLSSSLEKMRMQTVNVAMA